MPTDFDLLLRLAEERYQSWKVPGPHDKEIASLMAGITSADALKTASAALEIATARILSSFAERMSIMAVRRNDLVWIRYGLIAAQLAMRVEDVRDVLPNYALLFRAAELVGVDAESLFREMSYLEPNPETETPEEFSRRLPEDRTIEAMGFAEGNDREGFTFRSAR